MFRSVPTNDIEKWKVEIWDLCYKLKCQLSAPIGEIREKINNYFRNDQSWKRSNSFKHWVIMAMEGLSSEVSVKIRAAISAKLVSCHVYFFQKSLIIIFDAILERAWSLCWRRIAWLHHGSCRQQKDTNSNERRFTAIPSSTYRCFHCLAWRHFKQTKTSDKESQTRYICHYIYCF